MPALRQLSEALAAEEKRKELKQTAGPWRSKRSEAGLGSGRAAPKIEEVESPTGGEARAVTVKKGFLTGEGTKGSLYPNGSTEVKSHRYLNAPPQLSPPLNHLSWLEKRLPASSLRILGLHVFSHFFPTRAL